MTKLNEKRNAMARQYISQNYHEGSPAHDIATGIFIDAYDAALAEVKKWCPCGGVILADTEDWPVPMCNGCYEFVKKELVGK